MGPERREGRDRASVVRTGARGRGSRAYRACVPHASGLFLGESELAPDQGGSPALWAGRKRLGRHQIREEGVLIEKGEGGRREKKRKKEKKGRERRVVRV